jgi:hypothetical protein
MHYCLLGETGWLGCCLCRRCNFDANGNLLTLDNIGTLHWHYNNMLNKLTKSNKSNAIEYYVYDYQGNRVLPAMMAVLP